MNRIRVAFLLDRTNDWIRPYAMQVAASAELSERYAFSVHYEPQGVGGQDIVFILGYTKLLGPDFLAANGLNLVVHESALPHGKGFSPVQRQILEGKNEIPVCLLEAVAEADAGDIFERGTIRLDGGELLDEIRVRQGLATIELITRFLGKYPRCDRAPQSGEGSFYPRMTERDDELDPDRTLRELFARLRVADNERHPVFFRIDGREYTLRIGRKGR